MRKGARLSEDRKYRYVLWRTWDVNVKLAMFIGLNPTTADENEDDPTIRRCIRFAKDFECGGVVMLNLFAWRATKPVDLKKAMLSESPVGAENDQSLRRWLPLCKVVICAWGATYAAGRDRDVWNVLREQGTLIQCLGTTKDGHPRHPLYLRASERLRPWKPPWPVEKTASKPC